MKAWNCIINTQTNPELKNKTISDECKYNVRDDFGCN